MDSAISFSSRNTQTALSALTYFGVHSVATVFRPLSRNNPLPQKAHSSDSTSLTADAAPLVTRATVGLGPVVR